MNKLYALVDANNFYASCERVFNPGLIGKGVGVLSNNDGCIVARSNEAKPFLPMGAPFFEYKEIIKKHKIHIFSSNYALYADMSSRVFRILERYTPDLEIYSIDEAFMGFFGFDNYSLEEYARGIKSYVERATGIPVSIGIAPTKALAKVANRVAKKFPERTSGVYLLNTEDGINKALKWLPIGDVWGIGRQYSRMLEGNNVKNALQFTNLPDSFVKQRMSIVGLRLKHELQGKERLQLEEVSNKKAIACTRSFKGMYSEYDDLRERISTFSAVIARKLRNQKSDCSIIHVFVRSNSFRKDLPQYGNSTIVQLPCPTNSTIDITKYAVVGLKRIFRKNIHYKRAGILVSGLTPNTNKQLSLFQKSNPKHAPLMKTIDRINLIEGTDKVRFGGQDLKQVWKMNRNHLSKKYTTKLTETLTAHV
ncbi:MAG: Y-family DNA polymerase [Bacteroidota bacterium]